MFDPYGVAKIFGVYVLLKIFNAYGIEAATLMLRLPIDSRPNMFKPATCSAGMTFSGTQVLRN